ncbi:MAG: aldehyde dehydrogenase [Acidobacteria bacterium]|nr:aldehyde dehydrogenase [Acidobacteriota bacterium]MCI0724125.1 aldehyde dehydrogenase [Acidobacteriota bacterium]
MKDNVRRYNNFVNGKFVESTSTKTIQVENPATEELISEVPDSTLEEARAAIEAAEKAQVGWARLPAIERANHLRTISAGVRERTNAIARIISEEQGKTLDLARMEVVFTALYIDYMAEWARRIEGEILPSDRPNENIFIFRMPIGVIAGILPWNFPFFLVARKMAPALVTGNTIVLKPSCETPNNAFEFAKIVAETDLPAGVFNVVSGRGSTVGRELASNPRIGMVSLTGSVEAGSKVMEAASKNIIKVNLELGGKAPALVLADAPLDLAVEAIKNSRVINTGQVCNCAERIYVDNRVADEFTEKMAEAMRQTTSGNPLVEEGIDMGPLVSSAQLNWVDNLVSSAVKEGAEVLTGGKRAPDRAIGHFYEPTVLANCKHQMEIVQKEIFGPVVPIVTFSDLDEAIHYANDSEFGLTSSIYTKDLDAAMRACNEIKSGETYINRENFEALQGFHSGWRKSGLGGADGKHGLYECTQTHVVYVHYDGTKK